MPRKNPTKLDILTCLRCGYQWVKRLKKGDPKRCAKCKTLYWNKQIEKVDHSIKIRKWQARKRVGNVSNTPT